MNFIFILIFSFFVPTIESSEGISIRIVFVFFSFHFCDLRMKSSGVLCIRVCLTCFVFQYCSEN